MKRDAAKPDWPGGGRSRSGPRSKRVLGGLAGMGVLGFAALVAVGGGAAHATTGNTAGFPTPPGTGVSQPKYKRPIKLVEGQYVDPMLGRFVVSSVSRKAHILNGLLDIVQFFEGEDIEWYYGEIVMQVLWGKGPSTVRFPLYDFARAKGHTVAELVPAATVSEAHRYGIPAGSISFVVPKKDIGVSNKAKAVPKPQAVMTVEGHTFAINFTRVSEDALPPSPLPKAKQLG